MLPTVRAVLAVLAHDPLTAVLQVELAVSALLWNEMIELLRHWAATDLLHAEVVTTAVSAYRPAPSARTPPTSWPWKPRCAVRLTRSCGASLWRRSSPTPSRRVAGTRSAWPACSSIAPTRHRSSLPQRNLPSHRTRWHNPGQRCG